MLKWLAGALLLCPINIAISASTLNFQLEHNGSAFPQTAQIEDGKILVTSIGGRKEQELLFLSTNNSIILINHNLKAYNQYNAASINQMAAQAQILLSILGNDNNSQGSSTDRNISKTIKPGVNSQVSGFKCRLYDISQASDLISRICASNDEDLTLSKPDLDTLHALLTTGEQLVNSTGELLTLFNASIPDYGYEELNLIPIEIINLQEATPSRLVLQSIQTGVSGSMKIPENYIFQSLPVFN